MYWFAFLNRLSREWTVVSKDEARQNTYFGFGGWLLLFYLGMAGALIMSLVDLFSHADPRVVEIYGGNLAVYMIGAAVWVPFLVLAPMKHSLTPKVWIWCTWINALVYAIAFDPPGGVDAKILQIVGVVVFTSLMTWYILHSKRVNVTYLSRVPAEGAAKQPQSLPLDPAWKYRRIGWIVVGIVGVLLLGKLLQLMTSP